MSKWIKYLSVLTAAMLLCVIFVSQFSAVQGPSFNKDSYLIGDVDGDYDVTIIDATIIQRVLAGITEDTDGMYAMRGDVDEDGDLTIVDATFIKRYLVDIDTPYPIGEWYGEQDQPTQPPVQPTQPSPTSKPDPYELPPI